MDTLHAYESSAVTGSKPRGRSLIAFSFSNEKLMPQTSGLQHLWLLIYFRCVNSFFKNYEWELCSLVKTNIFLSCQCPVLPFVHNYFGWQFHKFLVFFSSCCWIFKAKKTTNALYESSKYWKKSILKESEIHFNSCDVSSCPAIPYSFTNTGHRQRRLRSTPLKVHGYLIN